MEPVVVQSVWDDNFTAESGLLGQIAPRARHVALNVQYPCCVVRHDVGAGTIPTHHELTAEQRYQVVRANVNRLKPLQVGLAIRTDDGRRYAWEFNLRGYEISNPHEEGDAKSIKYLVKRGLDFNRLPWSGIPVYKLRWMIHNSGLLRPGLTWATFTGAYHVAYFMHITFGELPDDVGSFMKKVRGLLGCVYDVKLLAREGGHVGSLEKIAEKLGVVVPPPNRFGGPELAGAGSMMVLMSFEALKARPDGSMEKHCDTLCGLQAT